MPNENETNADAAKELAGKAIDAGESVGSLVVAVPLTAAKMAAKLLREAADRIEGALGKGN